MHEMQFLEGQLVSLKSMAWYSYVTISIVTKGDKK